MPVSQSVPKDLGRYRIVRPLGKGGMGTVYEALDTQLDRRVALKVPNVNDPASTDLVRFRREARAVANLRHPNLCGIFDYGEIGGRPFLVMAFVEGEELKQRMPRGQPQPIGPAAALVAKLARAMQAAHERGVIHRDLKPANVLINQEGEPVIVDFGLARRTGPETRNLTGQGEVLGTPEYMAPEQATGEVNAIDARCDVYSLGIMLYELLTGRVPFEGVLGLVLYKHTSEIPLPPSAYVPGLDPALDTVCLKALAKKPDDRYRSMAEFATALDAFTTAKPSQPTTVRTSSRSPWPWLIAGNALAFAALAGMLWLRPQFLADDPAAAVAAFGVAVLMPALLCWTVFGRRSRVATTVLVAAEASRQTTHEDTPPCDTKSQKQPPLLPAQLAVEAEARQKLQDELAALRAKYEQVKQWVAKTSVSRSYYQPVLIVGPRNVGKTSLVKQWQVPWDYSAVEGTVAHRVCDVPLLKFVEPERVPHDLAPDVLVKQRTHLNLRVHDFPGELNAQKQIALLVREETRKLRRHSKKSLGVVIVCLFDAEEAHVGIRPQTNEYYNAELFRELRRLVTLDDVSLERLILVFNKFDLLRRHFPREKEDRELLALCIQRFALTCEVLRGLVNAERVCEIPTVLGRDDLLYKSQGATVVKGEAARGMVRAFHGAAGEPPAEVRGGLDY